MTYELVGVPYTSAARPGRIADGIGVLRAAGLGGLGVDDGGDLDLPGPDGRRGPSGLLNEPALGRLVEETRSAVLTARDRDRVPLLVGGDCPVILGALAALREHGGSTGLLMVDGHEDAWPPHLSDTGEASDCELGIALGHVSDPPPPLPTLVPLLEAQAVALLGPRDAGELRDAGAPTLASAVGLFRDDEAVRREGAVATGRAALALLPEAPFWLHLDLDVLSTAEFAAADYLQPGGLTWDELADLAVAALRDPRCGGCSLVIYNPDLDPERTAAARIVAFLEEVLGGER